MRFKTALLNRWEEVRNSYWFVPSLMAAGAVLVSFATLHADVALAGNKLGHAWWVYTGSASGARAVLQTIASSMIGAAGVVFSITTVTLTLAANKFGPRIFRNFMRDTGNQVVLGTFISTFLYCLLVLRQVRGSDGDYNQFIPQISMLAAVALAVLGLGVLIYFIHHVASSIQTGNVLAAVGRDLLDGITEMYPNQLGRDADDEPETAAELPDGFDDEAVPVTADAGGYIRRFDPDGLLALAAERDLVVRVERQPGDFLAAGDVLYRLWPPDRAGDELTAALRQVVAIGDQRTPAQDIRFPVGQLVEVACLALSPGVNDLYTAVICVDRLGEGMSSLAERVVPSAYRVDEAGKLRVVAPPTDLPALLGDSFHPIVHNGRTQPVVMVRLLETLTRVADRARRARDRAAVLALGELVREQTIAAGVTAPDRERIEEATRRLGRALAVRPAKPAGPAAALVAPGPQPAAGVGLA